MKAQITLSLFFILFLTSCQTPGFNSLSETERLNLFLDQRYDMAVDRWPEWQSYLGIKKDYDKLNDISEENSLKEIQISKEELTLLEKFDYSKLDEQGKISYDLFKKEKQQQIDDYQWRYYNYPINQLFSWHSDLPAFLINIHQIQSKKDAEDYIARINAIPSQAKEILLGLKKREQLGIIPPRFVFPYVTKSIQDLLSGQPFKGNKPSTLLKDFSTKIEKLNLPPAEKDNLQTQVKEALKRAYQSSLQSLLSYWKKLEEKGSQKDGIWQFKDGDKYYQIGLNRYTTTEMTAENIHTLGLREVQRIHQEMRTLQKQLGVKGTLKDFFKHILSNPKLQYANTDEGREQFLNDTQNLIHEMKNKLPLQFGTLPKAELLVKAVEPFREKSSASAFYSAAAPDGSRPGIYYVNLSNMKEQPKFKMPALTFHEAIPGHHLQLSISRELKNIPKFRKYGGFTAYTEGWGLYAEYIPKEMGFYQDLYEDFGRLSMELLRALRLVVDTGIHHKKWSREKAIQYTLENSAQDRAEVVRQVERYIVNPGQATAYKIGMMKILELRKKAQELKGAKFKITEFHDEILKYGALPLDILEKRILAWASL